MKRKLVTIVTVLLIAMMVTSSVLAGNAIKLRNVTFGLGSIYASGDISGLGNTDVTMVLTATGIPVITCINNGENAVPGQSYPKITATGREALPGDDPIRKNGRSPFTVVADSLDSLTWDKAGCPNANWTARIDFVFWTNATISVYQGVPPAPLGALLLQQKYDCTTTRYPPTITCTPVN